MLFNKPFSHYPLMDELISDNTNTTSEKCQVATQLTSDGLFTDSNSFDYFVLTPVPDENIASMAFRNNKTMGMRRGTSFIH